MKENLGTEARPRDCERVASQGRADRYRILFDDWPLAVCITDSHGRIVAANPLMALLLGFSEEDLIGLDMGNVCGDPNDWDAIRDGLKRGGRCRDYQAKLRKKDGGEIACLLDAGVQRGAAGTGNEYHFVIRDATEYDRTLKGLRESARRYKLLAETVTDGVWTTDISQRITYISPAIKGILGYTAEETLAKTLEELLVPASFKPAMKAFQEQIALENRQQTDLSRSWTMELEMYRKDGGTVWVEVKSAFLRGPDGAAIGLLGVTRDITDRKRTEDTLRALSSRLVEAQEAERRHIARELHDYVGQALTGLKLSLEMLSTLPPQEIKRNTGESLRLIGELMDRVRDMSLELRPSMLDDFGLMAALLQHFERYETQTRVRVIFKQKGLPYRRFAPELETAVYRIVQEGLTNVARHAGVDSVAVRIVINRKELRLQIEDGGVGFDPSAVLIGCSTSGLAGIRERVASLGGRLDITSAQGSGTRLAATFPVKDHAKVTGK
jgi:PAS domain S-box-containing protein